MRLGKLRVLTSRLSIYVVTFAAIMFFSCDTEESTELLQNTSPESQAPSPEGEKGISDSRSDSDGVNLLINGGLEEWNIFPMSYDMPNGWFCHNNTNVRKEHTKVYEGYYSAKMQAQEKGKSAIIDQRIAVYPDQKIRIRFHYYVEQWKSKGARTYCYFRTDAAETYNISTDELQAFYGKDRYYVIRGGGKGLAYLPHDIGIWQIFDETIEVPPTAFYFVFGINSYYGTTIYVDDCWVIDVTEQVPTGIEDVRM